VYSNNSGKYLLSTNSEALGGIGPESMASMFVTPELIMVSTGDVFPISNVLIPISEFKFNALCILGLCKSNSTSKTFFPPFANIAPKFIEQKVLPTLGLLDVISTTFDGI